MYIIGEKTERETWGQIKEGLNAVLKIVHFLLFAQAEKWHDLACVSNRWLGGHGL